MDKKLLRAITLWVGFVLVTNLTLAIDLQVSHPRGVYQTSFNCLVETYEQNTIVKYSIDGSKPTTTTGNIFQNFININKTTILRIIAYNQTDTIQKSFSYIFLKDIVEATYMSKHITQNPDYSHLLDSAFKSIPSISICLPKDIKIEDEIEPSKVEANVEMIFPGFAGGFSIPCGIKTWGGSPTNPKKNYRLVFKKEFGASKLNFDVFDDGYDYPIKPEKSFDNLLLRAGSQDGLNAEYGDEKNAQFIKNRFIFDVAMEMGYPAPHGRFVHVFLNGAYAGHYHLMERPDERFFESYIFKNFEAEEIEVRKNDKYWNLPNSTSFYDELLSYSNGLNASYNYEKMSDFIDVDAAADYITYNQFMANFDWHDRQNTLLGAIPEAGVGPFQFVPWDVDFSLGSKGVFGIAYEYNKHGAVPENLFMAKEFKFLQGDRVECLCKNNGILTPAILKEKYRYRAKQVEFSLIAEAARWGNNDYTFGKDFPDHKAVENWETNDHWQAEYNRIYNNFLENRTDSFIEKYVSLGRYSGLEPIQFSRTGNDIFLSQNNGLGIIVYTTDGSDPRLFGGEINPNAKRFSTLPIVITQPMEIKARFYKNTSLGRIWNNMCPVKYYPVQDYNALVINELHFAPNEVVFEARTIKGKKFEFIEIKNTSNKSIYLDDVSLSGAVDFSFKKNTAIEANGFVILASDSLSFIQKYGFSPVGDYKGQLSNSGETIILTSPYGNVIDEVSFGIEEPWPAYENTSGQSIGLINAGFDNNMGQNWSIQSLDYTPNEENKFCNGAFEEVVSSNKTNSSIMLKWDYFENASYFFEYSEASSNTWNSFETWSNFAILFGLKPCTTYKWRVSLMCNSDNLSSVSEVGQFSTMGCKTETSNSGEVIDDKNILSIFPNPAKNLVKIKLPGIETGNEPFAFKLFTAKGSLINFEVYHEPVINGIATLRTAQLLPGLYYVNVSNDKINLTGKLKIY